jgi:protein-L-isoaspartate(D-aspartate) O-methyltransferase
MPRSGASSPALRAPGGITVSLSRQPADDRSAEREAMHADQLEARGVRDPRVLAAMRTVPRHLFVPPAQQAEAYADAPLSNGAGQTISQPYVVALMTEALAVRPGDHVLDVGTGSGYQAAVLAALGARVSAIEVRPELAAAARERFAALGLPVELRVGDGALGWPERAPFDAIVVAAAAPRVPPALLQQLAPGGRLCLPLGAPDEAQELLLITRRGGDVFEQRRLGAVRFVPLTRDGPPQP